MTPRPDSEETDQAEAQVLISERRRYNGGLRLIVLLYAKLGGVDSTVLAKLSSLYNRDKTVNRVSKDKYEIDIWTSNNVMFNFVKR